MTTISPKKSISSPKSGKRRGALKGKKYRFHHQSSLKMSQCADNSIALTITSPPYWNSIDYDIHTSQGKTVWHREREYESFGKTFDGYLENIEKVFREVHRATIEGGFCAIVVGTILYKGKHYPTPMMITEKMLGLDWEFHQDIIWNKCTGGVKRAGCFIQHPRAGYYYPNIMTEYILVFRKSGEVRRDKKNNALAIDKLFTKDIANNIWHIAPVPPNQIDHPCPYPEELVRRLVLLYSQEGDKVLDPFLGSGQTALVALKNNRLCVGYDIERAYLELAEERLTSPPTSRKYNLIANFEKVSA